MDLASVLTPEIMAPILANADVQERLLPYLPSGESLPQTAEEIQNTLTSPQFQQVGAVAWVHPAVCSVAGDTAHLPRASLSPGVPAPGPGTPPTPRSPGAFARRALRASGCPLQALGMFSAALASGQLGPLMCQFGLPAEAVEAANKGGKYLPPPAPPLPYPTWLRESPSLSLSLKASPFAQNRASWFGHGVSVVLGLSLEIFICPLWSAVPGQGIEGYLVFLMHFRCGSICQSHAEQCQARAGGGREGQEGRRGRHELRLISCCPQGVGIHGWRPQ